MNNIDKRIREHKDIVERKIKDLQSMKLEIERRVKNLQSMRPEKWKKCDCKKDGTVSEFYKIAKKYGFENLKCKCGTE